MTSDLDRDLAGARLAQEALVDSLGGVTDEDARRASLLPDWTVGHVLTHLARNAESHTRMLVAARLGQVGEQYPGGLAQRAADIEAGADRPATALIADVVNSAIELADAWAAMTPAAWTGTGRMPEQDIAVADLPFRRWREVEVHRADLGLGFGWEDWSDQYVEAELGARFPPPRAAQPTVDPSSCPLSSTAAAPSPGSSAEPKHHPACPRSRRGRRPRRGDLGHGDRGNQTGSSSVGTPCSLARYAEEPSALLPHSGSARR